ncbi:cleavage and polyadenylation specificity factor subunit 6 isoform X2 [Monomorium pharaonis]|uniref:cleavage and polyadenylation specificity factor subunit 6 isoform X2 n=1 Tax=Monomorium pharaonis TaxID=307658 RepID=UPI00063F81C1|nr:cleavage and polyadenylation specificity factor subunit 6 isoform X2 [Monomorium pharaonis]
MHACIRKLLYKRHSITESAKFQKSLSQEAVSKFTRFFKVMDDFTSTCGEDELIGVHCTHGVNRTGYLICRYLIQQLGWEIQDSLKAFGEARGYPVERDIYLSGLKEVQRGKKIDTSKVVLTPNSVGAVTRKNPRMRSLVKNSVGRPMGPPGYGMSRRGFANGGPFSPQRFAGPPGFGPMPPPPGMPPIPPMNPSLYGLRPFRYGPPPMRQAMPPTPPGPRPGMPPPGFPPRIPGPPRMPGPPRLPPGPTARLPPPPKMPPPPPPPPSRTIRSSKQFQVQQKKQQIRNGIMERAVNIRMRRNGPANNRILPKAHKEQDFTVDTFEENLLATSVPPPKRQTKGRYNQSK